MISMKYTYVQNKIYTWPSEKRHLVSGFVFYCVVVVVVVVVVIPVFAAAQPLSSITSRYDRKHLTKFSDALSMFTILDIFVYFVTII